MIELEKYFEKLLIETNDSVLISAYYDFKKSELNRFVIKNEKTRIDGVLLGLSIAKKAWDKGLGREEFYENEIYYKEELAKLD
jgi:hypothetical protein